MEEEYQKIKSWLKYNYNSEESRDKYKQIAKKRLEEYALSRQTDIFMEWPMFKCSNAHNFVRKFLNKFKQ